MQSKLTPPQPILLPKTTQETDSHCGPAVLQSLFGFLGKKVTQDQVVTASRNKLRISEHGTRPDQIAHAVTKLTPQFEFWYKQKASREDLDILIHKHRWPVAVNWQGLFYDTLEEEQLKNPRGDHGHYSVAIDINIAKDEILIADPYSDYSDKPRIFSLAWFESRWWDTDKYKDRITGKKKLKKTTCFIFIVTPKGATFPKEIGMKGVDEVKKMFKR
jgi:hypothetical protein